MVVYLIESTHPSVLYHITSKQALRSIKKRGIVVSNNYRNYVKVDHSDSRVYLTTDPNGVTANSVRMSRVFSKTDSLDYVVKVNVRGLKLYEDEEGVSGVDFYVKETISPDRILGWYKLKSSSSIDDIFDEEDEDLEDYTIEKLRYEYQKLKELNAPKEVLSIKRKQILKLMQNSQQQEE